MNELEVSFLGETGEDRAEVREVLGAAGFEVSEHPVPGRRGQGPEPEEPGSAPGVANRWPELLQLLIFAQAHWKDAALLLGLLNGLIVLYDRLRASNREAEIEVRFEARIYTVVHTHQTEQTSCGGSRRTYETAIQRGRET